MSFHAFRFLANAGRRARIRIAGLLAALGLALAPAVAAASQVIERKLSVDGRERTYTLVVPDDAGGRSAWPVIVAFHPAAARGDWMFERTRLHAAPGGANFVVAYPDGFYPTWNAGDCCGRANRAEIDDVAFFRAMLRDIASLVPIRDKAYLAGFSNGARMVYHLMCTTPDLVAAGVAVGATRDMTSCKSSRIPLLHIHGLEDKGSPVEGGRIGGMFGDDIGYMEPARTVAETVARRNGCNPDRTSEVDARSALGTTCTVWNACPGDADVMLCLVPEMGHAWPGAPAGLRRFGPFRPDLAGSAFAVSFFARH